jgi:hypothetical protein
MGDFDIILEVETGRVIPVDPENSDYQKYQAWLAEGNIPDEVQETQTIGGE